MNEQAEHQALWHRIAWLINGRASASDRQRLLAHLQDCGSCRAEYEAQKTIYEALQRQTPAPPAELALQRFWARHGETEPDENRGVQTLQRWRRSARDWLLPLAVLEAVAVGALGFALWLQLGSTTAMDSTPANYRTLSTGTSSTTANDQQVAFRMVLAPTMTLAELQQLAQTLQLQLVAGPSEAGVFSLAAEQTLDHVRQQQLLQQLRATPGVVFAEPVAAIAVAAP